MIEGEIAQIVFGLILMRSYVTTDILYQIYKTAGFIFLMSLLPSVSAHMF